MLRHNLIITWFCLTGTDLQSLKVALCHLALTLEDNGIQDDVVVGSRPTNGGNNDKRAYDSIGLGPIGLKRAYDSIGMGPIGLKRAYDSIGMGPIGLKRAYDSIGMGPIGLKRAYDSIGMGPIGLKRAYDSIGLGPLGLKRAYDSIGLGPLGLKRSAEDPEGQNAINKAAHTTESQQKTTENLKGDEIARIQKEIASLAQKLNGKSKTHMK